MQNLVAAPTSREALRRLASSIRKATGYEHELEFPVLQFLEFGMPTIFGDNFQFLIGTPDEMGICHGLSNRRNNFIMLREDVYEGAYNGVGRDRLTCAHEIGHFFLHPEPVLARTVGPIKTYQDPEWQANAFAGELLIPFHLALEMPPSEIVKLCSVSEDAALTQYRAMQRRRNAYGGG